MDNSNTKKILADNVRLLRAKKRFSQEAVAGFAQLGQSQISDIENENSNPNLETIIKIADALNVKVRDLFEE